MHYRYGPDDLERDLVFRAAPAIVGGRGMPGPQGELQEKHAAVQNGGANNFQGRYVILHPWEGEVTCANPTRGRWGGPPGGAQPTPRPALGPLRSEASATEVDLSARVASADQQYLAVTATPASDLSLGVLPEPEADPEPEPVAQPDPQPVGVTTEPSSGGCASCATGGAGSGLAFLVLLAFALRRRH